MKYLKRNRESVNKKSKPEVECYFGAIPCRAFTDVRITNWQFRLLGVICAHDRLGRNGRGCDLGIQKLASLTGTYKQHASAGVILFERWGYLTRERDEMDGRKWILRVVYDAAQDRHSMGWKPVEEGHTPPLLNPPNPEIGHMKTADSNMGTGISNMGEGNWSHGENAKSLADKANLSLKKIIRK
jgi:hypothetical protein